MSPLHSPALQSTQCALDRGQVVANTSSMKQQSIIDAGDGPANDFYSVSNWTAQMRTNASHVINTAHPTQRSSVPDCFIPIPVFVTPWLTFCAVHSRVQVGNVEHWTLDLANGEGEIVDRAASECRPGVSCAGAWHSHLALRSHSTKDQVSCQTFCLLISSFIKCPLLRKQG